MAAGFKTATVNASDVAATLTDYPSYVDLSRLGITTLAEAQSVRVYADESKTTEWAREIVSATEMHVKVPSLTSTVDIYVDWDGVRSDYATTATYGAEAVWGDYFAVWHGGDTTNSTGGTAFTANGGMSLGTVAGKIGDASDFDGVDDYVGLNDRPTVGSLTVQAWANPDSISTSNEYGLLFIGGSGETEAANVLGEMRVTVTNSRMSNSFEYGGGTNSTRGEDNTHGALSTSSWQMFHNIIDTSTNSFIFYKDGAVGDTDGYGVNDPTGGTTATTFIGTIVSGYGHLDAKIQQVRIRESVLSSDWITTEYNNQNDEPTFWGTWTDVAPSTGFKQATVNASDVPSTQTDFPSYIDLSRVGITTLAEAQGVRVYSDASKTTELAREIVSATEMHVKIPSLTSTTTIYVDWDDSRADYATTATYGAEAVWSDYNLTLHLNEGSVTAVIDSSGNHSPSKKSANEPINATGKIDDAQSFDGSNDYINVGNDASLNYTGNFSATLWIKTTDSSGPSIFGAYSTSSPYTGYGLGMTSGKPRFWSNTEGAWRVATNTVNDGTWHHIAYVLDTNTIRHYNNGATNGTGASQAAGSVTLSRYLGVNSGGSSAFFNGDIDEFRLRSGTLSANWITTEYNNQSDEAGFWGTWTDASSGTNYTLTAAVGALTLTGIATSFIKDLHLVASAASFALTGFSATLMKGKALVAETASFALTGTATSFSRALSMATTAATFTLTGVAATFSTARTLAAQTGEFILTGYVALLEAPWSPTEWTPIVKNSATFTAISKAVTNWTSRNKS